MIQKWLKPIRDKLKNKHYRRFAVAGCLLYFYLAGLIAQIANNRYNWRPGQVLALPSMNPFRCLLMLFTPYGMKSLLGLLCVSVIVVLLFIMLREDRTGMKYDTKRKFWYSGKGIYGTANWMEDEELRQNFDVTPVEQAGEVKEIIYGVKDGMVVSRKADSRLNPHIAVMGASGSRKSRTIARGLIIAATQKATQQGEGESLVVCDPKGELCADTRVYLENKGYDVKILHMTRPELSDRFDALDGGIENPIFVASIVQSIIDNTGGPKGDATFDDAEANLLSALIFLQIEGNKTGEYPTIKGAYWTLLSTESIDEMTQKFSVLPRNSRAKMCYNLFLKASPNLQGNIVIGLGVRLSVLQNEEIAELMSYPDMDFRQLGQKKTAYFLILSDQDNTLRFVSATFFSLLFLRLVQFADNECPGKRLPVPVNLICDEFCALMGSIPGFNIKLSNLRSRGFNICIIFQQLGQLQNRYPDQMWSEIIGNTDTIICLGCSSDPVTAKFLSDRSGEVTIYADTVMKQRNVFLPSLLQPNFRHSEGAGRRKLLTPDECMRMEDDKMLVMVRGCQMLELEKFDYTHNPESKKFIPSTVEDRVPERFRKLNENPAPPPAPADTPPSSTPPETGDSGAEKPEEAQAAPKQRQPKKPKVPQQLHNQISFDDVESTKSNADLLDSIFNTKNPDGKEVVDHDLDSPPESADATPARRIDKPSLSE